MRRGIGLALAAVLSVADVSPASADDKSDAIGGGVAVAALAAMLCWTTNMAAQALEPRDHARSGPHLGLRGGYTFGLSESDLDSELHVEGASVDLDDSWGVSAVGGYRCHPRLSAELQVEWLDTVEIDVDPGASVEVDPLVLTVNLKGHILTGRFQPYLLVGGGATTADIDVDDPMDLGLPSGDRESDFTLRFGGGLDVYATKNLVVSVGADYVRPLDGLEELDYLSVGGGIQYRF